MKGQELLARVIASLVIIGMLAGIFIFQFGVNQKSLKIQARMAENGGWLPDTINAKVGEPIHLELTSGDVIHSFAIGQSELSPVDIEPGKVTRLTLVFDKPGSYTFYCTRWCGLNHWRMQGTIHVSGSSDNSPPVEQPLYVLLGIDIDGSHNAASLPLKATSTDRGQSLIETIPSGNFASYLERDYYLKHSPYQAYADVKEDLSLGKLSDSEAWDLVAYIWKMNSTPDGLDQASSLFAANCAACHGEGGSGDGVFSDDLARLKNEQHSGKSDSSFVNGHGYQTPASFTDQQSMLGASPALLQGKILRGGMGTGMPYWGPIFTEEQTWNLVSYLYTLAFKEVRSE